jgi:cytochrome c oxidase subunit 4
MAHAPGTAQQEQHGLTPRQYIMLGLALTLITVVELWVSYSGMARAILITVLVVLSSVKFAAVVAFFMHLRFENSLMTKFFVGSFLLAVAILFALLGLFWGDLQPARIALEAAAGH